MRLLSIVALFFALALNARAVSPNIIVIYIDDLGWPDLGCQGATDVLTPNIDSLAANGVRFTNGYVTCPVCSPSRAGLLTGRYQQRFGHEMNPGQALEHDARFGLPLTECTMGNRMKDIGYATGWIGKSHLGTPESGQPLYHPRERGFDRFFGFLEGHHNYCFNKVRATDPLDASAFQGCDTPANDPNVRDPILDDYTPVQVTSYLTTVFGNKAAEFVNAHASERFFMYMPVNAVHEPIHVTPELINDTAFLFPDYHPNETNPMAPGYHPSDRHKFAAMLLGIDRAVGEVLTALRSHPDPNFPGNPARTLEHNTLIFLSDDNGAPPESRGVPFSDYNGSVSAPLRGNKGEVYDGGIRVPYLAQWKGTIAGGQVIHKPVSTLDILPTAIAAAGATVDPAWQLDGVNLLPLMLGQTTADPHSLLFWRVETSRDDGMTAGPRAVRQGEWKLVKPGYTSNWELYHIAQANGLADDIDENNNLADANPNVVKSMIAQYEAWEAGLDTPRWDYSSQEAEVYSKPQFVLEDIRLGGTSVSYLGHEPMPEGEHIAFQDASGALWLGRVDRATGFFLSADGRDLPVDAGLSALSANIEGAQWGIDSGGAALFYTKPGGNSRLQIRRASNLGLGTTVIDELTTSAANDSFAARVSQNSGSTTVKMAFHRGTAAVNGVMVADESTPGTAALLPNQAGVDRNGRWIPGTQDIVYVRTVGAGTQLARYGTATGTVATLTNDLGSKTDAWAFLAPEYGYELCYAAVIDRLGLAIYRDGDHDGAYDRVATLSVPVTETARYIYFTKPLQGLSGFNGMSYFTCAAYQNNDPSAPGASAIWLFKLGPYPVTGPSNDDTCLDGQYYRQARRLDDSAALGVAFEPETLVGEREVFCYYSRRIGANPVQLRLARTGLVRPDSPKAPSGFAGVSYSRDYTPPDTDSNSLRLGGTETTSLVAHQGKLFAGLSSRGNEANAPIGADWTGAQILIKDSPTADWRVDHPSQATLFRGHKAVEVLQEVSFTKEGVAPVPSPPVKLLIASLSDITSIGATHVSTRTRISADNWQHSEVAFTSGPAYVTSYAVHLDRDVDNNGVNDPGANSGIERIFAGLNNGEVYRGVYDQGASGKLAWNPTAELTSALNLGPVLGLAEANGVLFAACGMRQDNPGDPVTGGLYMRNDHTDTWTQVYAWNTPQPAYSTPLAKRVMTALTAVQDPQGCADDVLLAARSWPGVIERIDVKRQAVVVELDVRDYFARLWNDPTLRTEDALIGYTPFVPAKDPVTGDLVHLLDLWIEHPASGSPPHNGSHYLVRYQDGTYEAADIENFSPSVPAGQSLRASRCFAPSPFAADNQSALYIGGYDSAALPGADTAWIMRGAWGAWPELDIAQSAPSSFVLTWLPLAENWRLESSATLGAGEAWQPVLGKPTISPLMTTLGVTSNATRLFFRLSRP